MSVARYTHHALMALCAVTFGLSSSSAQSLLRPIRPNRAGVESQLRDGATGGASGQRAQFASTLTTLTWKFPAPRLSTETSAMIRGSSTRCCCARMHISSTSSSTAAAGR